MYTLMSRNSVCTGVMLIGAVLRNLQRIQSQRDSREHDQQKHNAQAISLKPWE